MVLSIKEIESKLKEFIFQFCYEHTLSRFNMCFRILIALYYFYHSLKG